MDGKSCIVPYISVPYISEYVVEYLSVEAVAFHFDEATKK